MPKEWVPGEQVDTCYDCGIAFSFVRRRHHCRLCGRVFCHPCSSFQSIVPNMLVEEMPQSPPTHAWLWPHKPTQGVRLCKHCFDRAHTTFAVQDEIDVFLLLAELQWMTFREWARMRAVCTRFKMAIDHLLHMIERIPVAKLPNATLSQVEKRVVAMHREAFSEHPSWALYTGTFRAGVPRRRIPCSVLGCQCTARLSLPDAVEVVLNRGNHPSLYAAAIDALLHAGHAVYDYLYVLCYAILRVPALFNDLFVPLMDKDEHAIHRFAFAAKGMGQERLFQRIKHFVNQTPYRDAFHNTERFGDLLQSFLEHSTMEGRDRVYRSFRSRLLPGAHVYIPGHVQFSMVEIRVEQIQVLDSSTRPVVVPCVCRDLHSDRLNLITLLCKNESVLPDAFAMNFTAAVASSNNIPAVVYHVQPLGPNIGFLSMVNDASTLFQITQQNRTVLNHLLQTNPHARVKDIQTRFAQSCALSCCVSHCIAVGDRHLDNVMITDSGLIFHIDFGYCFGQEVFHRAPMRKMSMKLTPEIVDALGGRKSDLFVMFQEHTIDLFNFVRSDVKKFYYSFVPLCLMQSLTPDELKGHIEQCLIPDLTHYEADVFISESIRRNTAINMWDGVMDRIKFLKKTWF